MPAAQVRLKHVLDEIISGPYDVAAYETLRKLAKVVKAIIPIQGQHMGLTFTPDGIQFNADDQATATDCGFDAEMQGLTFQFLTAGALIGAGMPTNMFDGADLFSAAISSDPTFIKLSVTTDGNAPTGCEIVASGSPAAPIGISEGTAPSAFEIDLWAISAGVAVRAFPCGPLQAVAVVALESDADDPVCGSPNVVRWYTWVVNPNISGG